MKDIELGSKVYEQQLGIYNQKTQLFESNNNWWRGEEPYNTIKYCPFYSNTNRTYLKHCEQLYLYEGLIKSAEPEQVVKILKKNAEGFIHDIRIVHNPLQIDMKTPVLDFFIHKDDYYDLEYGKIAYEELGQLINNLGYFISGKKETDLCVYIVIMPKFLYEVTSSVYESSGNDGILYHITPAKYKQKIEKYGLIPKHANYRLDNYPDRIYFYTKLQVNKLNLLCKDLSSNTGISDWLILKIDLKDRRSYIENDKSTMYRFFEDPKAQNAVFTYENIDPQCISIYKELKVNNF